MKVAGVRRIYQTMRRVFYPSRPSDVIWGFLGFAFAGGLVALLIYGMMSAHSGGAGWGLFKLVPFAFLGLSRMLYRERVVMDGRRRTITAEKWFFLFPIGRESFPMGDVSAVAWQLGDKGFDLNLQRKNGSTYVLARADRPDEALERELEHQLGCNVPQTNG